MALGLPDRAGLAVTAAARAAEREGDVLDHLGQEQRFRDAGVERLVEDGAVAAGGEEHDRSAGVLADRDHLVQPAGAGVGDVQHRFDAAALQRRRRVGEERARVHDLDLVVVPKVVEDLVETVGAADHADGCAAPDCRSRAVVRDRRHPCGPCGPLISSLN